ncbi:hypothetical protein ABZ079_36690 [Streptomyces sp. NPDC006314]|uniref:hypothetical protein n=1 Tax=Streptomyces sp. NPDC006314 TaxID=3154475 RepID=UPI00339E704C
MALSGILPSGQMYVYLPDGKGGFDDRSGAYVWPHFRFGVSIDPDLTGYQDGGGRYNIVFSPGTLGGAKHPDLLARDK